MQQAKYMQFNWKMISFAVIFQVFFTCLIRMALCKDLNVKKEKIPSRIQEANTSYIELFQDLFVKLCNIIIHSVRYIQTYDFFKFVKCFYFKEKQNDAGTMFKVYNFLKLTEGFKVIFNVYSYHQDELQVNEKKKKRKKKRREKKCRSSFFLKV